MFITIALGFGLLFFLIANLVKFFIYQRMPIHLRWELYPVPHENPARALYGGSRVEETMWWMQPYKRNKIGAFKYFLIEVVILKAVWEHNRRIWIWSYLMHTGLYALVVAAFVLPVAAILDLTGLVALAQSGVSLGSFFYELLDTLLIYGSTALLIGSAGLLTLRLRDESFRSMSSRENWINLGFLIFIGLLLAQNTLTNVATTVQLIATTQALATFSAAPDLPFTLDALFIAGVLFLIYFPFTSMTHLYTKWFTYHNVRWDDTVVSESPATEKKLADVLSYGVDWAGVHTQPGKKSWADVAVDDPAVIGKNRTNGNHKKPVGENPEQG